MRPHRSWKISWYIVFTVLLAAPGFEATVGWNYAVIIDAGSTGSRVHVYRYYTASSNNNLLPAVELPEAVHKTSPGLSAYAFDPKTAARSLMPLLKFAKEKVPADQIATTPIQLMATAGLRMLNNGSAEAVLNEVRSLLSSSGFDFDWPDGARVLSGTKEGLWGWLAINYATGALQAATLPPDAPLPYQALLGRKGAPGKPSKPAAPLQGVVELGGASLQVTFMPKDVLPAGQAAGLVLPRLGPDRLYSRSFDGLGVQAALKRWAARLLEKKQKKDPCLPTGYAVNGVPGAADWGSCRAGVKELLPLSGSCLYPRCGISGSYLPNMDGAVFLGLDNFYYTASALGLASAKPVSVNSLEGAAKKLCSKGYKDVRSQLQKQPGIKDPDVFVSKLCFSSALIIGLLKDALHIDPAKPLLMPSNSVPTPKGTTVEVNWSLGALLSGVLQQGGKALGTPHDHIMLAAPGSGQGASDATAAAAAASFCLLMLVVTSVASYWRVGVAGPPAAAPRPSPFSAVVSAVGTVVSRVPRSSGGGAIAPGSERDSSSSSSSSSSTSKAKYTRMRSVSPNTYSDLPPSRPPSRPPSVPNSGGGGMIEVTAFSTSSDRRGSEGRSSTGVGSQGGRVPGALSAPRQR